MAWGFPILEFKKHHREDLGLSLTKKTHQALGDLVHFHAAEEGSKDDLKQQHQKGIFFFCEERLHRTEILAGLCASH